MYVCYPCLCVTPCVTVTLHVRVREPVSQCVYMCVREGQCRCAIFKDSEGMRSTTHGGVLRCPLVNRPGAAPARTGSPGLRGGIGPTTLTLHCGPLSRSSEYRRFAPVISPRLQGLDGSDVMLGTIDRVTDVYVHQPFEGWSDQWEFIATFMKPRNQERALLHIIDFVGLHVNLRGGHSISLHDEWNFPETFWTSSWIHPKDQSEASR